LCIFNDIIIWII